MWPYTCALVDKEGNENNRAKQTCASLRSLMGMPIVDVILACLLRISRLGS